jgi:hypothetical protein
MMAITTWIVRSNIRSKSASTENCHLESLLNKVDSILISSQKIHTIKADKGLNFACVRSNNFQSKFALYEQLVELKVFGSRTFLFEGASDRAFHVVKLYERDCLSHTTWNRTKRRLLSPHKKEFLPRTWTNSFWFFTLSNLCWVGMKQKSNMQAMSIIWPFARNFHSKSVQDYIQNLYRTKKFDGPTLVEEYKNLKGEIRSELKSTMEKRLCEWLFTKDKTETEAILKAFEAENSLFLLKAVLYRWKKDANKQHCSELLKVDTQKWKRIIVPSTASTCGFGSGGFDLSNFGSGGFGNFGSSSSGFGSVHL